MADPTVNEDAAYAIWHDPTQYDHFAHGPPYLPGMKVDGAPLERSKMARVASDFDTPIQFPSAREFSGMSRTDVFRAMCDQYTGMSRAMASMGVLLSTLRAEAFIHQTHHWQTRGAGFYGDHLLFDRLYNDSNSFVDTWAERTVGTCGYQTVDPVRQAAHFTILVAHTHPEGVEEGVAGYPASSLAVVEFVLWTIQAVRVEMESAGTLSSGTDNLLQGIADKHEEFVYLLKQRTTRTVTAYNYDRR